MPNRIYYATRAFAVIAGALVVLGSLMILSIPALAGSGPAVLVAVVAGSLAAALPLAWYVAPLFSPKYRYEQQHERLAGPRPGARLG